MINKFALLSMILLSLFQFSPSVMAADCNGIERDGNSRQNEILRKFNSEYADEEEENPYFKVDFATKVSFKECTGYITMKIIVMPEDQPIVTGEATLKGKITDLTDRKICYKNASVVSNSPELDEYKELARIALLGFTTKKHCLDL